MTTTTQTPPKLLMTERLLLCQLNAENAVQINDYHRRNRDHFSEWSPLYEEDYYDEAFQKKLLNRQEVATQMGSMLKFWLVERHTDVHPKPIVGDVHFNNIIRGAFQSCFLGYKMDKNYLRCGYMFEALNKAIQYMFTVEKLHRIEANIMPYNDKSIALIEKLGFVKEGFSPKYLKINGKWENHLRYALINDRLEQEDAKATANDD